MRKQLGAVLVMLIASTWSGLVAESKTDACSLLTNGEISDAVGEKVAGSQRADMVIAEGPSKGETMGGCMWHVGDQGMVSVNLIRALKGAQREASLTQLNQVFDALKAQGWTEEKKNFGDIRCSIMTPPSSMKDVPISTGCMAEAKGWGIGVGWMSGNKKLTNEKLKGLLDKAIGRLR
jgi:hypothetical protein